MSSGRLGPMSLSRLQLKLIVAAGLVALALGAVGAWIVTMPRPAFAENDAGRFERGDAARGKLVFAATDCSSCHASPGQSERTHLGGGMALASPFGTLRVPNISSDPTDGIGAWRGIDLANAVMSGVSPDGSHYYPALPYSSYVHMSAEDARDLVAYLRTLPPVAGRAPPHELPFPFTIRRFVGFWKLLFFDRGPLEAQPERGRVWSRGQYLVEGLGHCAECHSARNELGGIKDETRFAGGSDPEGAGFAPNITPARLGDWSEQELASFLATGRSPSGRMVGSTMKDVVANLATLPEEDRTAIAVYIKSLPPKPTSSP
jgi:mono/diheme cytochrome c family protein